MARKGRKKGAIKSIEQSPCPSGSSIDYSPSPTRLFVDKKGREHKVPMRWMTKLQKRSQSIRGKKTSAGCKNSVKIQHQGPPSSRNLTAQLVKLDPAYLKAKLESLTMTQNKLMQVIHIQTMIKYNKILARQAMAFDEDECDVHDDASLNEMNKAEQQNRKAKLEQLLIAKVPPTTVHYLDKVIITNLVKARRSPSSETRSYAQRHSLKGLFDIIGDFQCTLCLKRCITKRALTAHMQKHEQEELESHARMYDQILVPYPQGNRPRYFSQCLLCGLDKGKHFDEPTGAALYHHMLTKHKRADNALAAIGMQRNWLVRELCAAAYNQIKAEFKERVDDIIKGNFQQMNGLNITTMFDEGFIKIIEPKPIPSFNKNYFRGEGYDPIADSRFDREPALSKRRWPSHLAFEIPHQLIWHAVDPDTPIAYRQPQDWEDKFIMEQVNHEGDVYRYAQEFVPSFKQSRLVDRQHVAAANDRLSRLDELVELTPALKDRLLYPKVINVIEGHLLQYDFVGKSLHSYMNYLDVTDEHARTKHYDSQCAWLPTLLHVAQTICLIHQSGHRMPSINPKSIFFAFTNKTRASKILPQRLVKAYESGTPDNEPYYVSRPVRHVLLADVHALVVMFIELMFAFKQQRKTVHHVFFDKIRSDGATMLELIEDLLTSGLECGHLTEQWHDLLMDLANQELTLDVFITEVQNKIMTNQPIIFNWEWFALSSSNEFTGNWNFIEDVPVVRQGSDGQASD